MSAAEDLVAGAEALLAKAEERRLDIWLLKGKMQAIETVAREWSIGEPLPRPVMLKLAIRERHALAEVAVLEMFLRMIELGLGEDSLEALMTSRDLALERLDDYLDHCRRLIDED